MRIFKFLLNAILNDIYTLFLLYLDLNYRRIMFSICIRTFKDCPGDDFGQLLISVLGVSEVESP